MSETQLPGLWPWLGGGDPGPETRRWVQYEDGTLGRITTTQRGEPVLARPGRLLTQGEYDVLLTAMRAAHDERVAALKGADAARQVRAYRDLVSAGIPEATARQLSGYTGPGGPP